MTSEMRTTVQLSDLRAVEFECVQCHGRIVRPIATWHSPLLCCPECGAAWQHYRGTMDFLASMASQLAKVATIDDAANGSPFIVRIELKADKKQ